MVAKIRRSSRIAAAAIALFLLFDFAALALNVWLSRKIEKQAIAINLAGRQRMLSQRMTKALLQIDHALVHGHAANTHLQELKLTQRMFDDTLAGFHRGHVTAGGNNQPVYLEALTGQRARDIVTQAESLWQPYNALIKGVVTADDEASLRISIQPALEYALQHNLKMLDLMNSLTTELELLTQQEAGQIRWFQGAAFALALLNFFGAIALYLHRLRLVSRSHGLLDTIIDKVSTCVLVVGADQRIAKANHMAGRIFGYEPASALQHLPFDTILRIQGGEQIGICADGSTFLASLEQNQVFMDEATVTIVTVADITQQRRTESTLSELAYHDILTKLPNRQLFDDRLNQEIAYAQRNSMMLAVLFLDIDRFKPVNDTYGHAMGDKLLQHIAVRLRSILREVDTVSRRGGDEFTVIVTQVADRAACETVAQTLLEQLSKPFLIDGIELQIGASIGISLYPDHGADGHTLVAAADAAMYRAKEAGRNTYRCYQGVITPE